MHDAQPAHGELVPGVTIAGKYTLVRPLGVGGMGAVWVARNEATGAEVAMKLLLSEDDAGETMARFRREAHATARMSHRGIVRIYDLVELPPEGKRVAIVMELLHGRTLAAHLAERGRMSVEEALAVVLPLLSALAHAHGAGIIHRDLKPENVFLSVEPDGLVTPKILDFGISKVRLPKGVEVITREGEMIGTPSYMSPEQVRGRACVDARSDLFNVGILLYELLSGRNPFAGDGLHSVVVAILEEEAAPIDDMPPGLWGVIERALRKSPDERFACAVDLAEALRVATGMPPRASLPPELSGPISTRPFWLEESSHARRRTSRRGWPLVASAAAAAGLAAVTAAFLALWTTETPVAPRPMGLAPGMETPLAANASEPADTKTKPPSHEDREATPPVPTVMPPRTPPRRPRIARDPGF
jgi:serine/threonine-protein kinase